MTSAIAHRTDPATSHAAAQLVNDTGRRVTNMEIIGWCVKKRPGLTASQYATIVGLDAVETRRRLTDLKNRSLAFQSGEAKPSGRRECRWWPALEQGTLPL